jgi:DNA-binding MarR family transcriptional regulator
VTHAVNRLEEQGYVRRVADPADRRTVLAQITAAGRRLVDRATAALGEIRFGMEGMDNNEARRLAAVIRDFRKRSGDFG